VPSGPVYWPIVCPVTDASTRSFTRANDVGEVSSRETGQRSGPFCGEHRGSEWASARLLRLGLAVIPLPTTNDRSGFGQGTFTGMHRNDAVAPKAVVPAPRLTAALVKRLQTRLQLRLRYLCLAYHQDSAPSFRLSISSAEQLEPSRELAGRGPGAHRRSIVSGSASRRSTIRTEANWILPGGWRRIKVNLGPVVN
jgi:hypothetical protein